MFNNPFQTTQQQQTPQQQVQAPNGFAANVQLGLGGLQTLGSLWSAFQQNKLANKSLNFQQEAFNANLGNSTQQYNTSLEDRVRARYATEGRSEEADAYISKNKLPDRTT